MSDWTTIDFFNDQTLVEDPYAYFDELREQCPVLPLPAFPHDQSGDFVSRTVTVNGEEHSYLMLTNWAGLIGVVGLPSAVAPVGRTTAGLPVGLQVVAPFLRDREAVQLAGIVAGVSGGGYQPPPGF